MNIFKCADCHEESWFADGTDGHCLKCEAERRKQEAREEPPACDCSKHDAQWLNDTQEWQCVRCYKKRPRHECQCDGCQKRFGVGPKTEWSVCNKHIKYESGPPIDFKIESLVMTKKPRPSEMTAAELSADIDSRLARLSPLPDNSLPDCAICHKIIDDRHLKTEVEMGDGAKRLAHETCYKVFNGIPNSTPDDSHYHKGRTDPWGYIIANELNFFEGNVVKYVTRWRHKNGLDDLRKARVYIDELIRQEEAKETP